MYKNILIAADGSENSLRATQQAADIASLLVDAKVELVSHRHRRLLGHGL